MIRSIALLTFFAFLTMLACAPESEPPQSPTYDESILFTLEFDETSSCTCDEGPDVSFIQLVEDSRCPTLVACIWEGQVIVKLDFNEQDIELGISSNVSIQAIDTVGQWSIELLEVRPHPENANDIPVASDYELDLIVRGGI